MKETKKICDICQKHFEGISDVGHSLKKYKCKNCGRVFNRAVRTVYCSQACRGYHKRYPQQAKRKDPRELFLKGKPKANNPMPLEVLDKIAERKRVFDDEGWDHFLKGRKWDRI